MRTPTLLEATKLILYDNGMVNRGCSESEAMRAVGRRLCKFAPEELKSVDEELAKLSKDQLEDVCCGEQHTQISALADKVLSNIFEEQP